VASKGGGSGSEKAAAKAKRKITAAELRASGAKNGSRSENQQLLAPVMQWRRGRG